MEFLGDEKAKFWLKVRIGLVAGLLVLSYLAVGGRVYYLQTVEAAALEERTAVQRDRQITRKARRGDILDRNGVELAVSVEVPSIAVRPNLIENPEREARRLMPHLDRSFEELRDLLSSDRRFIWLERQAKPATAEAIRALDIKGVEISTEYKRYYPMRELAGQLLGFVGIDGDGLEGLERQFQEQLAGGTYQLSISRDARGRAMLTSEAPQFEKFEGNSLVLTIDEKIQRTAEEALAAQIEEFDATSGYAVVMDVRTGDVLAMATAPAFDPNRLKSATSADWRLRPVTDTFEPGSVFKPFLLAAALEERTTTLERVYNVERGAMRIGRYTIHDVSPNEEMTTAQIMQKSSNIGSYKIAQELGRERYYEYIRRFGFGSATGVGLRGEQGGLVWPPDRWAEITFANVAFGQGLTTTTLQMTSALAAIANGGRLMQPRIISEIRDRDGRIVHAEEPTMIRRVLSEEAARQTAWAMSLVTIAGGTGRQGALEHFTVAAKTGTAQKVNPETRRYDPDLWVSGYIGFAPAERPEVAIAVFIDEPKKARYGGVVAGPAFKQIAQEALAQRGTLPLPEEEVFKLTDDQAPRAMRPALAPPAPPEIVVLPTMRVFRTDNIDEDGEQRIPDFRSMTLRQAVDRARNLDLIPQVSGWGRVIGQDPEPGTPLALTKELTLMLSPEADSLPAADQLSLGSVEVEQ